MRKSPVLSVLALALALAAAGGLYAASNPRSLQLPFKPSEHHERLLERVGVWDGDLRMYMPGSDQPMESKLVETVKPIKDPGEYEVVLNLAPEVKATIIVTAEAEE